MITLPGLFFALNFNIPFRVFSDRISTKSFPSLILNSAGADLNGARHPNPLTGTEEIVTADSEPAHSECGLII